MLPLTFVDPADYDKISPFDKIKLKGLTVTIPRLSLSQFLHCLPFFLSKQPPAARSHLNVPASTAPLP